ncbi:HAD family hydrolase [Mucisphaera sp.]|uniref:HAD family hydrolase n=1 Tax=Mucisphaera sp. TaxID=2913024 RepID=UPI003D1085E9
MSSDWLVLLDIDGTLLTTEGVGPGLMQRASDEVLGGALRFDRVDFSGNLDPLIVSEAAAHSGVALDELLERRFREAYVRALAAWVEVERPSLLPGAEGLVAGLRRAGVGTGLVTGNFPEAARIKLDAVGLGLDGFEANGFGDDAADRPGLVAVARERHGTEVADERVVVVGDTPRDVACAKAHGCVAVAVTTGRFGREELAGCGADRVLDSLEEAEAVLGGMGLIL